MIEDSKNRIEDIKRSLYNPKDKSMSHTREVLLNTVEHNAPIDWKDDIPKSNNKDMIKKTKMSPFKKFFVISLILFLIAIGFAFYKFLGNDLSVSGENIEIQVIGNSFTKGGENLPLQIEIDNKNKANLEFANLIVEYPKGAEDNVTDVVRIPRDSIGTIKSGEKIIRNIDVKLFGVEKSIRNIKISLEYHPEGSNAIFTKDKYYPVTISLAPLSLSIDSPTSVISNQLLSIKVKASLNTSLSEGNPVLQVSYPNNFVFESASPVPLIGNSIWSLSSLSLTDPVTLDIKGRIVGQEGEDQVFHAYAGTTSETDQSKVNVIYSSILQKIEITKPFLSARILVNDKDQIDNSVLGGSVVNVSINWMNNLSTLVTDGQIIVNLDGNVFDESTIKTSNGFYDSANNQITWDRNLVPQLSEINPGENGNLSFSFIPKSSVGSLNAVKDPQVRIKVSIRGRQPQLGYTFNDINNFSEKIVKVFSDLQIAQSGSYLSGNNPPKAETETKYTINWTLSNSSNNITEAEARAIIPIYVNWVGLSSLEKENIKYNEITREVIWDIGQVLPNTGMEVNREASFILSIKPSLSQVGSVPQLIKEVSLSGKDSFTGTILRSKKGAVSTSVFGGLGAGRVIN
jgi:hypothetical protein